MRFVCVSDTHNQLSKVKLPDGDILLHAGDWTMGGKLPEVASFAYDLRKAAHRYPFGAVIVAGNHDFLAEKEPRTVKMLLEDPKITYLLDQSVRINGFKIWGSPWQPWFLDWAFNLERGAEIKEKWDLIPADIDVLITHGPPAGILDRIPNNDIVGCVDLWDAVRKIQPKLHVMGHIHHSYGTKEYSWPTGKSTMFVNASTCTEKYKPTNEPLVIDL